MKEKKSKRVPSLVPLFARVAKHFYNYISEVALSNISIVRFSALNRNKVIVFLRRIIITDENLPECEYQQLTRPIRVRQSQSTARILQLLLSSILWAVPCRPSPDGKQKIPFISIHCVFRVVCPEQTARRIKRDINKVGTDPITFLAVRHVDAPFMNLSTTSKTIPMKTTHFSVVLVNVRSDIQRYSNSNTFFLFGFQTKKLTENLRLPLINSSKLENLRKNFHQSCSHLIL